MLKKYLKTILHFTLGITLIITQIFFINILPLTAHKLNLVLIALVFILIFNSYQKALQWAVGLGLLIDLYSFLPFGFYTINLIIVLLIINFLLTNVFTNKSFYSVLILIILATFFYNLIFIIFSYLTNINFTLNWHNILKQIFYNSFISLFLFYLFSLTIKKFNSMFIDNSMNN